MQHNIDIILFSLSRWDSEISSPSLALAKEFSKNSRVFYINHPYSIKDFINHFPNKRVGKRLLPLLFGKRIYESIPGYGKNLIGITPKLTWPINFLPHGKLYNFFSILNNRIIANTIKKVIKDNSIEEYIFLNCFDPYFLTNLPSSITPDLKIYQSMDDITQETYSVKHGARLENEIISNFDLTLTTSKELLRLKKEISPNVYYHPNAVDLHLFLEAHNENTSKPTDWVFDGRKTIGYIGAIESRIDYHLLKKIAIEHPDKILVMIGPIVTSEYKEVNLDEIDNVVFLGKKRIEELPSYLKFLDVALIPFKKNTLTKSIYPLKINEYLAAGKAVVATDFSEDIVSFEDVIYIGRNYQDFAGKINQAISENNKTRIDARVEVAKKNTWTARVDEFWNIIDHHLILLDYNKLKNH